MGLLRRVIFGPQFRAPTLEQWHAWADGLAACVLSTFNAEGSAVGLQEPVARRIVVPEEKLGSGGRGDKPLVWHRVDCGGFRVLGVNAEPVTAYRRLIEALFDDVPLFTAGCIDQTHGYLPVDSMLHEGGYEVNGFRRLFDYQTRFRPGLEHAVVEYLTHS